MSDDAPKPPGRRGSFDEGHGNERFTLDNIMSEREQARTRGEIAADRLWSGLEEAMGGPGSFRASMRLQAMAAAHEKFGGEDIRFDEDDFPYMHYQVAPDIHVEYPIPHPSTRQTDEDTDKEYFYGTMYKTNDRGQKAPLDALYIRGLGRHNPRYIKDVAHEWVDETYLPNKEGYDRNVQGDYQ